MEEWLHEQSCTGGRRIPHEVLEKVARCDGDGLVRGRYLRFKSTAFGSNRPTTMKRRLSYMDLSRFCAAPSARLSHVAFESDGAFPAQC